MKSRVILLFVFFSAIAQAEPWTHRVWQGEMWGEPAQLDDYVCENTDYARRLSYRNFPWEEWSVWTHEGQGYEIDCNGHRRILDGPARKSLFLRWQFDTGRWRDQSVESLKVMTDSQGRPLTVTFSNHELQWDYAAGPSFVENEPGLQRPMHFTLLTTDSRPPVLPPEPSPPQDDVELPLSLVMERWTQTSLVLDGKPSLFLVDTGASNDVVDSALVRERAWPRVGKQKLEGGMFTTIGWARLPSFEIGGHLFPPQNWLELDLETPRFSGSFPGIHGILGHDFLARYTVQFDYPASRLRLFAHDYQPAADDREIPVRRTGPGVEMEIRVGNQKGYFTLDTGSGGGILVQHLPDQRRWVPLRNLDLYEPEGAEFGSGLAGTWPGQAEVQVGPFRWAQAPLEIVDEKTAKGASLISDGNVGVGFLRHFRVTMDLKQGRLWMAQGRPFRPANRGTFGLPLRSEAAGLLVGSLPQGGPAARAGIRKGDRLLRINGTVARGLTASEYLQQAKPGELVELELEREGRRFTRRLRARAVDVGARK